jgi:hypothetical protein
MIVLRRNDKTIVLTGWRARAFSLAAIVLLWALMAGFVFVVIGITLSIGIIALLLLPATVIAVLIQAAFGRRS